MVHYTITLRATGAEGFSELQVIAHLAGGSWSNPTGGLALPSEASGNTLHIAALPAGATYTVDYSVAAPAGWVSSAVSVSTSGGLFIMTTNTEILAVDSAILPDPYPGLDKPDVPGDLQAPPGSTDTEDPSVSTEPDESSDLAGSTMPSIVFNTSPAAPQNSFVSVVESAGTAHASDEGTALSQDGAKPAPSLTLGDASAPLSANDFEAGWSLANLLAALATLIAVFLHVFMATIRGGSLPAGIRTARGSSPAHSSDDEGIIGLSRIGVALKLVLATLAMLTLAVFFLTGDIRAPMTLTDGTTGTMIVLLFSTIIIIVADFALSKIDEYEDEYNEPDQSARAWLS
jgi:hypothetical protein